MHSPVSKDLLNACTSKISSHYWPWRWVTRSVLFRQVLFFLVLCLCPQQSCISVSKSLSFNMLYWNIFSRTHFCWLVVVCWETRIWIFSGSGRNQRLQLSVKHCSCRNHCCESCSVKDLSLNSALWISKDENAEAPTRWSSHIVFYFAFANSHVNFMDFICKWPSLLTIQCLKNLPLVLWITLLG